MEPSSRRRILVRATHARNNLLANAYGDLDPNVVIVVSWNSFQQNVHGFMDKQLCILQIAGGAEGLGAGIVRIKEASRQVVCTNDEWATMDQP